MNFKDYIQGKRHGREANQLEHEAMNDPFLQDAIDGFDSVQGNHLPIIEELERKIEKKSKRKVLLIRYATISIAASVALLIGINLIFNEKKSDVREIAKVNEVLSESLEHDTVTQEEIALNQTRKVEKKAQINQLVKPSGKKIQAAQEIRVVEDEVDINDEKEEKMPETEAGNLAVVNEEVDDNIFILPKTTSQTVNETKSQSDKISASGTVNTKKNISGRVVDENGQPVIGASVFINDKNATITDADGKFALSKIDGEKITVKYIGFQSKVVDIKEDTNIIQLQPDNLALNEVVVTGYGRKTKRDVTGSIATVENKTTSSASGIQVKNEKAIEKFEQEEFRQFIFKNLKENICEGTEYKLTASFKTDKTGKPYDVKIISSNCREFEQEFLRIVQLSPAWTTLNKKIMFTITKP